jgi:predicted helicase
MRQSIMRTFEQIYVLDLHGNTKKKERAPDGTKDENVFDIEQGVAISLLIKKPGLERGVWRGDFWGSRLTKYLSLAESSFHSFVWKKLEINRPQYLFIAVQSSEARVYEKFWGIPAIFPENTPGVITARDRFSISLSPAELEQRVSVLISTDRTDSVIRKEYGLKDTRGWSLQRARVALRSGPDWRKSIRPLLQAPFDSRYVAYDERLIDWGRWRFISRFAPDELGLCLPRKIDIQRPWEHAFVADELISHHAVSMKEVNYFFPLHISPELRSSASEPPRVAAKETRLGAEENLSSGFRAFVDSLYEHHYTPEEILGYIYAVLYAPSYRTRYGEFLRLDFPRIPFPDSADDFEQLSGLGWALVQAHLLRELPRRGLAGYHGKGDHTVAVIRYSRQEQAIWINDSQCFKGGVGFPYRRISGSR